jgi:hypothetical protein
MRFVVRVDDCGWTPDKTPDVGLEYFRRFRRAARIDERTLPIVWGFIPAMLTVSDLAALAEELRATKADLPTDRTGERLAVHGWDHALGAVVSAERMLVAIRQLSGVESAAHGATGRRTPIYIAPFNQYGHATIAAWSKAVEEWYGPRPTGDTQGPYGGLFLGGFVGDAQSGQYGPEPIVVERNVVHVPAAPEWYGRTRSITAPATSALLDLAKETEEPTISAEAFFRHQYQAPPIPEMPVVLTLHLTWEEKHLDGLGEFFDAIADRVFDPDSIFRILQAQRRTSLSNGAY